MTIVSGNSAYPDLAPSGASGNNTTPFTFMSARPLPAAA